MMLRQYEVDRFEFCICDATLHCLSNGLYIRPKTSDLYLLTYTHHLLLTQFHLRLEFSLGATSSVLALQSDTFKNNSGYNDHSDTATSAAPACQHIHPFLRGRLLLISPICPRGAGASGGFSMPPPPRRRRLSHRHPLPLLGVPASPPGPASTAGVLFPNRTPRARTINGGQAASPRCPLGKLQCAAKIDVDLPERTATAGGGGGGAGRTCCTAAG